MPPERAMMKRAASEELGEGNWAAIKYNRQGRPIRKSAGKKTPDPAFVNFQVLEDELEALEDGWDNPSSDEELEEELEEKSPSPRRRPLKRQKRAPSPTPPRLSPPPPEDVPSGRVTPEPLALKTPAQFVDFEPINLTFNIPIGFSGPLQVQLDLSNVPLRLKHASPKTEENHIAVMPPKVVSLAENRHKKGFLSFPPGTSHILQLV